MLICQVKNTFGIEKKRVGYCTEMKGADDDWTLQSARGYEMTVCAKIERRKYETVQWRSVTLAVK